MPKKEKTQGKDFEKDLKGSELKEQDSRGRRNSRGGRPEKSRSKSFGFNDPSWYAKNPQLLKDAASLAFANFQGIPIHDTGNLTGFDFKPASIMAIDYIPTFGKATSAVDAINIAVRNIYSFVRHANSGHSNYEPADLGNYLFATTEMYGLIAWLEHIYGISRVYSVKNRSLPKQLLSALGFDADNVLSNQAEFRFAINRLIQKIASLCIPKGMSLLERRIWMNSFTFKDADTDKASLYVFRPIGYYKYEPTTLPTGGCLAFNYWPSGLKVYDPGNTTVISIVEGVIDAILQDEDMNIMSGDILKAYGDGGLASMNYLPEDYFAVPVYQPEVLPQIHNMVLVMNPSNNSKLRSRHLQHNGAYMDYSAITSDICLQQKDGILYNDLYIGIAPSNNEAVGAFINGTVKDVPFSMYPFGKVLLDLPTDSATPEEVMVASRLHPTFKFDIVIDSQSGDEYEHVYLDAYGSELAVALRIWNASNTSPDFIISRSVVSDYLNSGGAIDAQDVEAVAIGTTQFDMAPIFYYTTRYNLSLGSNRFPVSDFAFDYVIADLYNFTAIQDSTLYKLHTTAILSEVSLGTLFAEK